MCSAGYFFILNTNLILDFKCWLTASEISTIRAETMIRTRDATFVFKAFCCKILVRNLFIMDTRLSEMNDLEVFF